MSRRSCAQRVVQGVASRKMGFAGFLGARLGFTQCGVLRFEIGHRTFHFQREPLTFRLGFALLQQPEHLLTLDQLLIQSLIAACYFRLNFQTLHLVAQF